jgi:ethanolamine permease
LSVTHGKHKTPNVALIACPVIGLAVMLMVWFTMGGEAAGSFIGGVLLNMAVFGAMFSYLFQGLTFIQLRRRFPNIERPNRRPFGVVGGGAYGDHRAPDHWLLARRSRIPHRRYRRGDLVCASDH